MAGSIPLECRLCPKKPDFSDVSHLLTHVASKAHLSRYYQMKVKGSADDQVRRLVDDYDDWYERYSIDDLMRDRLNSKDKRSGGGRAATNAAPRRGPGGQSKGCTMGSTATKKADTPLREATVSSRSTPAAAAQNGRRAAPRPLRDSVLNPQLEPRVKIEPDSRSGTPLSSLSSVDPAIFLGTWYALPSWPNTPYAGSPMKQETLSSSRSDDDDDDSFPFDAEYGAGYTAGRSRLSNNSTGRTEYDDEYEDTVGETTSDVAKLKGLVWPGMAMFDSATPDMRRKRNQKKDYSVIEQLRATSEWVEPNEMIFDAYGTLRKERVITGNPDMDEDDSLLSGEIEPEPELPKKRPTRKPRPALVEKNRNTGRVTRRGGGGHHPGAGSRHQPFGKAKTPYFDGAMGDDDDLTFGAVRPRKRAGLSIHRDNTGPEITFEQPAPLNYLVSGFRNPFQASRSNTNQHHTQPLFTQQNNNNHQRLPSFTFTDSSFGSNFRPSTSHGMPMQNYASFGGLNAQTLFQHNPYQTSNGAAAMTAFQQQFGQAPPPTNPVPQQQQSFNNALFQSNVNHGHSHSHNTFNTGLDDFATITHNLGIATGDDYQPPGTELNPLFFSSNQPTPPQDDEGTISPPGSERYRTEKAGGVEFRNQTSDTVKKALDFYRGKEGSSGGGANGTIVVRAIPRWDAPNSTTAFSTPIFSNGSAGSSPAVEFIGEDLLRGYYTPSASPDSFLSPAANRAQLYGTFMDVYLPKNTSALDHFSFFHTLTAMPTTQPALTEALDALSLIAVGGLVKDPALVHQSVRKYGRALGSLMHALSRPQMAGNDELLAAATVLATCGLYDEIGKHDHAWGTHVTGGQQLIAARGPKSVKSKLALLLFSNTRHGALVWSLIQRKAPYMALPEWRALAFEAPIRDSSTLFYDAAIRIPGLLERYDGLGGVVALSAENIDAILRDCEELDHQLRDWFFDWEVRFAFEGQGLYEERPIDEFTTFTSCVQDRTFETAFWFRDFPIAYLASVYWLSMYHLRFNMQSLHKLRHDLDRDWFPDPSCAVPEDELATYITHLCRTIPFFTEPISSSTGHVGIFLPLSTAAGYFIQRARWAEAKWIGLVRASVFTRGLSPPSIGGLRPGLRPTNMTVSKLALVQHEKMFPWQSARDAQSPSGLSRTSSSSPNDGSPASYTEALRSCSASSSSTPGST
ncbi:hypothetical protein LTR53_013846 [Teratosphaeriaceae sp. CCFEE 6253]|nr:hypothetical protein LTR53_013846 [Teratosphaeriaceae sp. CCFEE 6253]